MSRLVGIFEREADARAASGILARAEYDARVLRPTADPFDPPTRFKHRGEVMFRAAVKGAVVGSLIVEVPLITLLLLSPFDVNLKVLLGSTAWKFGAAFGAWIGSMLASERGLDAERADDYERELLVGRRILAVDVSTRDRRFAHGAILESGALEVRNVVGTFEVKEPSW